MTTAAIQSWKRYEKWLRQTHPALAAKLRPPASDAQLSSLQKTFKYPLPPEAVALWKLHDGESEEEVGILAGFHFMSVNDVLTAGKLWAGIRADMYVSAKSRKESDALAKSLPPEAIQCVYSHEGWLPLWKEPLEGNYLGVDYAPGTKGTAGQVINFGRDEDNKAVLSPSLTDVLRWLATEAEEGRIVTDESAEDEDELFLRHAEGRVLGVLVRQARARLTQRR